MEIHAFQYIRNKGWSVNYFPDLDSSTTLLLVFAAPIFFNENNAIKQLKKFYCNSIMLGCSTAGEIFGEHIFDDSLSVAVVKFDATVLKCTKVNVEHINSSYAAGEFIAHQLDKKDLHSIFILSDGLNVNGSELVKGLNTALNDGCIVTGGLAGDGSHFNKTWTILNGEILENHIVAVGFYGKHLCVGHASQGGWDIFGPIRRVTRSKANILYELDYHPALQLYKKYLGDKAVDLPASGLLFPLAISDPQSLEPVKLVRTILSIDEKNQSLIFAGDIPQVITHN
jgi:hypothetical protein